MTKINALIGSLFIISSAIGQKATGKLKFEQGQTLEVNTDMKSSFAQQVMGQAIDFSVTGTVSRSYKVTNSTDDNSTLRHEMKRINFLFDGMGQKISFDSDNPKDIDGRSGKPMKELLEKKYDVIIDPNGKVLMANPEKFAAGTVDDRMKLVMDMMQEMLGAVNPPKKGEGSFFRVLPENEAAIGESWSESGETEKGPFSNTYTLTEVNDSTIVVNFTGTSTITNKSDMMGMESITTLNNKTTGTIILDKKSSVVKQKNLVTETNGSTQVMGNSLPVTSKTTTTINVKPVQ
jgi:hypothetical protein